MTRSLVLVLVLAVAPAALADPQSDGRAHADAFGRAMNAGDVKAALALYTDDARVIFPGRGEEAHGKAEIEKLLTTTFAQLKGQRAEIRALDAVPLDDTHMVTVGRWEIAAPRRGGKPTVVRTTEVLVKTADGWRYLVDHASIGAPPPPAPSSRRRGTR